MEMFMHSHKLLPGLVTPPLEGQGADGHRWTLGQSAHYRFTLLIFYRGAFCSICRNYLQDYDRHADAFAARGVDLVFISADNAQQADAAITGWQLEKLRVCHGLSVGQMEQWGAFMSAGDSALKQPAVFSEPALFLIRADGILAYQALNSAPFARPHSQDIIGMLDFMEEKKEAYPQRGGWQPAA
jgi:peroxiredoxin